MIIVGNDVVDLTDPRVAGKASEARFLERIFDQGERAAIAAATEPDLELWLRWAAKEAAYKVVSKLRGKPPTFAHRAFVVSWSHPDPCAGSRWPRSGSVRHGTTIVDIEATCDLATVHEVAWVGHVTVGSVDDQLHSRLKRLDEPGSAWSAPRGELEDRLTERELEAVHSRASAAVRIAARASIAEVLAVDERRLEIICAPGKPGRRPPSVLLDGEPGAVDISLSHDGAWIAWAFALQRP